MGKATKFNRLVCLGNPLVSWPSPLPYTRQLSLSWAASQECRRIRKRGASPSSISSRGAVDVALVPFPAGKRFGATGVEKAKFVGWIVANEAASAAGAIWHQPRVFTTLSRQKLRVEVSSWG